DRQVVPLDMAGAYRTIFYRASHPLAFGADYFGRIVLQPAVAIFLYDDAELAILPESQVHRFGIGREAVNRNLRATIATARLRHVIGQLDHEPPRIVGRALAEQVMDDQPAVLVLRGEQIQV